MSSVSNSQGLGLLGLYQRHYQSNHSNSLQTQRIQNQRNCMYNSQITSTQEIQVPVNQYTLSSEDSRWGHLLTRQQEQGDSNQNQRSGLQALANYFKTQQTTQQTDLTAMHYLAPQNEHKNYSNQNQSEPSSGLQTFQNHYQPLHNQQPETTVQGEITKKEEAKTTHFSRILIDGFMFLQTMIKTIINYFLQTIQN